MTSSRVSDARMRYEKRINEKKPLIDNLMEKLEKEHPGHGQLMEKEKPLIAELMVKLRNREHEREVEYANSYSDASSMAPMDTVYSTSSSFDSSSPQDSTARDGPAKSPKRARAKTPLEKLLVQDDSREQFKEFITAKGALEDFEFFDACALCERKAHGTASLARKIIGKLMKEIKETHGHPEKAHMDLALNSAVIAVRYELLLHKEETLETAREIVDLFVRDNSPQRVNLTTERRNMFIHAVDFPEEVNECEMLRAMVQAQHEIRDLMEKKYLAEFNEIH